MRDREENNHNCCTIRALNADEWILIKVCATHVVVNIKQDTVYKYNDK